MTAPALGDVLLETDRLVLRRFTDSDAAVALLLDLDSDPEVLRYIGPVRLTADEYRERIRTWLVYYRSHPARGTWALAEKAGGVIGWVFLRPATAHGFAAEAGWTRPTDLELGYRLRRAAWGRGLCTEAAAPLVRLALADPEVTAVVAMALVPNQGSTRVMEKVGMTRVREFALPGYTDPLVMYAACRPGCCPP